MSSVRYLTPRENLIDAVLEELQPDGNDYSATAVLFQGKRPAPFLRKRLAERRGSACIPPIVFSLESFVDYCYADLLRLQGRDVAQLDAIGMLFDEHRAMSDRLGGENFIRLESFFPLGLRLLDALEELRLHNTDPTSLRAALPLSDFPAGERLSTFYEAFYRRLADEQLTTYAVKASRVAELATQLPAQAFRRTIVAGFYAFAPVERAIIARVREWDSAVFFFQQGPGLRGRIEGLGFSPPAEGTPSEPPVIRYVRAQGIHGEILGMNRLLVDDETAPPMDERTVIVLPSAEALFPVSEWTVPLIPGGNYNISLGYPAHRTPTFGFLEGLLTVLESRDGNRFSASEYVRFLLHPYTKNLFYHGQSEVTRILVHAIQDTLAGVPGGDSFSPDVLERDTDLFARVKREAESLDPTVTIDGLRQHLGLIHERLLRSPVRARSLGEFAADLSGILTFIDDNSPARRHGLFRRFASGVMEALEAIRTSRIGAHEDPEGKSYIPLVLRWLQKVSVPFAGTPVQGVQILGLLETRNLQFEHVFILDMNDEVLPGSPDVDPLLPPPVRTALHLPGVMERQEAIDYYFMALLGGARSVSLFSKESPDTRRSRFVERMIWQEEKKQGNLSRFDPAVPVRLEVNASNQRPLPLRKSADDLAALRSLKLSASAVDAYLQCPLQFYYGYVLHLRERRDVEPGIEPTDIGMILHEVLREIDAPFLGQALRPRPDRETVLRRTIDEVFLRRFGSAPSVPLQLMRSQMVRQLGTYRTWYEEDVLTTTAAVLEGLETPLQGEFAGMSFVGRADRIERRGERKLIIDFKTGGNPLPYRGDLSVLNPDDPGTWQAGLKSTQLPLYMLMAGKDPGDILRIDPVYVFLGSVKDGAFEVPLFGEGEDRLRLWERITATLNRIVRAMLDPEKEFQAPVDLDRVCPRCPYRSRCGTGWVRARGTG
jgi:ATP-dependent helicase/nuclease subunit B